MGPKELAQMVADQEGLVTAYKHRIRSLITTKTREDLYQQRVDDLKQKIELFTSKLEREVYEHDHADDLIAEAEANIRRLRREISLLKNQASIAKLLELADQINNLQANEPEE